MFVSLENGILGASPDGVIGLDGLVEVKCPFNARYLQSAADVVKQCSYLQLTTDGQVQLKRSSHYFRQIVMQLHVSGRQWCDFVVWTQGQMVISNGKETPANPNGYIVVLRILKDDHLEPYATEAFEILQGRLRARIERLAFFSQHGLQAAEL